MKERFELGIKYGGSISRNDIRPGDVIEIVPEEQLEQNRRYVVSEVVPWKFISFDKWENIWDFNDSRILGVIRWYPADEELEIMTHPDNGIWPLRIDYPDWERQESPVFTYEMLEDYEFIWEGWPLSFTLEHAPDERAMDTLRLYNQGYAWNKRWIIWDSLKFYSFGKSISYFI